MEEFSINEDQERIKIIEKMLKYKFALEKSRDELEIELVEYYTEKKKLEFKDGVIEIKEIQSVSYENPTEAYLLTQIKITENLPPVIEEHIRMLNVGDDIDLVLDSFHLEVYQVKKDIYSNLREWEVLLNHITDERLVDIKSNPKGHGDLILKELIWLKDYEKKYLEE